MEFRGRLALGVIPAWGPLLVAARDEADQKRAGGIGGRKRDAEVNAARQTGNEDLSSALPREHALPERAQDGRAAIWAVRFRSVRSPHPGQ